MEIKLVPHEGWQPGVGGRPPRKVTLAQDRIEIDGDLVGFIGHQKKASICLIGLASPGVVDRIRNVINMYRNEDWPERPVVQPSRIIPEQAAT